MVRFETESGGTAFINPEFVIEVSHTVGFAEFAGGERPKFVARTNNGKAFVRLLNGHLIVVGTPDEVVERLGLLDPGPVDLSVPAPWEDMS